MTGSTPFLAHLAEALRAHRQRIGAGNVPRAFVALESELLVALSGTQCPPPDVAGAVAHPQPVLVDAAEAARMLSVSVRKVRQLRSAGQLRAVTIDRAVRFAVDDVVAFSNDHKED